MGGSGEFSAESTGLGADNTCIKAMKRSLSSLLLASSSLLLVSSSRRLFSSCCLLNSSSSCLLRFSADILDSSKYFIKCKKSALEEWLVYWGVSCGGPLGKWEVCGWSLDKWG